MSDKITKKSVKLKSLNKFMYLKGYRFIDGFLIVESEEIAQELLRYTGVELA